MQDDDEQFRKFAEYFEKLFSQMIPMEMDIELIPEFSGYCNCCFLRGKGHQMTYFYENHEQVHLFICVKCRKSCKPEEACEIENFEDTYKIYVTDKN